MKKLLKVIVLLSSVMALFGTVYYYLMRNSSSEDPTVEDESDELGHENIPRDAAMNTRRSYVSIQPTNHNTAPDSNSVTTDELIGEEVLIEDFLEEESL